MGIVRFINGETCNTTSLTTEGLRLLTAILNKKANPQELARLCCKAGICPLVFRDKITSHSRK